MSLYQQFASYGDLNPPTTFDSPLTLSGLSPLNSTSDSVDHLTSLDLSAYGTSTSTSQNFNLNPNSVERILHLPHIYSPVTPPDRSQLARLGTTNLMTNGKVNSITTSVIVANSSITSSTTATMSKSIESSRFPASKPVTSSTVSTIVMQSTEKNNQSSASGNQPNVSCLICGDIPLGKNFGIVTCGSCKIFFRRNINFADKVCSLKNMPVFLLLIIFYRQNRNVETIIVVLSLKLIVETVQLVGLGNTSFFIVLTLTNLFF